jgi:hypothetical protein
LIPFADALAAARIAGKRRAVGKKPGAVLWQITTEPPDEWLGNFYEVLPTGAIYRHADVGNGFRCRHFRERMY